MADKRKVGPTPPRQPQIRRLRSVPPLSSAENSEERPPRTSTPFDSSFTDYRAPREPLSPLFEDGESSEEDLFYNEEEEELGEPSGLFPLPPHNSLENEPAPGLLLPVLLPPPQLPPQLPELPVQEAPAVDNMAAAELSEAERSQRTSIETTVEEVRLFITPEETVPPTRPRYERAAIGLDAIQNQINKLQVDASKRIGKIPDGDVKEASKREWTRYKVKILNQVEDLHDELVTKDPRRKTAEQQTLSERNSKEAEIQNQVDQIKELLNQVQRDLTTKGADGREVSKGEYTALKTRMIEIKKMIRPGLDDLYKELINIDPEKAPEARNAHSQSMKSVDKAYSDLWNELHAAKLDETILTFQPQASSTHNQSGGAAGLSGSIMGRHGYNYGRAQLPVFNKTSVGFPAWMKEMVEDVLPYKGPEQQIRIIAEQSGHMELIRMFDDPDEVWAWLKNLYANETVVCEKVIGDFLNRVSANGHNDAAKLVNLYMEVKEVHLTLKKFNEQKELTDSRPMIAKIIMLIPNQYREEFATKLQEKEEADNTVLRGGPKYDFLMKWMKTKYGYISQYMASSLTKVRPPPPAAPRLEDGPAKLSRSERKKQARINAQNAQIGGNREIKPKRGSSVTGGPPPGAISPQSQVYCDGKFASYGPCPCCGEIGHYYEGPRGWGPSQNLNDCPKFVKEWSVDQRAKLVIDKKFCSLCLSHQHRTKDCKKDKATWHCRKQKGNDVCKGAHSSFLCGTKHVLTNHVKAIPIFDTDTWKFDEISPDDLETHLAVRQEAMLPAVRVEIKENQFAMVLLDGASNCTLIRDGFALELGLKPFVINTNITVCGNETRNADLKYYAVTINLATGPRKMYMLGMEQLTTVPGGYDVSVAYTLFPHCEPGSLEKPGGAIDILVGQDNCDLLPSGGQGRNQVGKLRVSEIPFGPGRVLTGSHDSIKFENPSLSPEAYTACYHTTFTRPSKQIITCTMQAEAPLDFYEAEMLGTAPPARCHNCQECETCTFTRQGMTAREKVEFQQMKEAMVYDPEKKRVTVSYPVKDPEIKKLFRNNRQQAVSRQSRLWNSLVQKNQIAQYNEQFKDYIDREVLVPVSDEEIRQWEANGGKTHWVAHHGVENPGSLSTKLRIVVDSSLKNHYTGPRLTDLYVKGPNTINDLLSVMISWRTFCHAGCLDVKKAYHSLFTTEEEKFMRMVIWRFSEDEPWQVWGYVRVGMGDISAAGFLELAKAKAAELGVTIDPMAAQQLLDMSYVDDGLYGGSRADLERMRGEISWDEAGSPSFSGTFSKILALIGCRIKGMCVSGDTDPRILEKQGKVLGHAWDPPTDTLSMAITLRLVEKKKNRTISDVPLLSMEQLTGRKLTRRMCLQFAAQTFDPLGLISAYTIRFKLLMREIVKAGLDWEDNLPADLEKQWLELIEETLSNPPVILPRSITTQHAVGRPELVVYSDGSCVAFGAVVYVRWNLLDSPDYHTALVTSKSRVCPTTGLTAPRSELQGLLVAARLADIVVNAFTVRPRRLTMVTDSQCTVAAVSENANALNVFFANRVLEYWSLMDQQGPRSKVLATEELTPDLIEQLGEKETWVDLLHHTPGPLNPADMPTRDKVAWDELARGKLWQDGPDYLRQKRQEEVWPLKRDFVSGVPPEEKRKKFLDPGATINFCVLSHALSLQYSAPRWPILRKADIAMEAGCLIKAQCILARVCRALRLNNFGSVYDFLERRDLSESTMFLQMASMHELANYLKEKGRLESLNLSWRGGVARTRGRVSPRDMAAVMGHQDLVAITATSRLAYLVMKESHEEDHRAAGDALWRTRRKGYWIIKGMNLAKKVVQDCMRCKKNKAKLEEQIMADLPPQVFQVPCRAFTNVQLDYAGAVTVKDQVKRRVGIKAYPLLFVCMNSGMLHVQLCPGYDANTFISQFQQFVAIRGSPSYIHTDQGSQLVAAGKQIQDGDLPDFPWDAIKTSSATRGVEFVHCPTQAQWRNGRAESMVRALKRTLRHLTPVHCPTFAEYSSLLSRAAYRINQRPLGVRAHNGAEGEVCVITPHMLTQGGQVCSSPDHEEEQLDNHRTLSARMEAVEDAFVLWWRQWMVQVWDSLVPTKKWRTAVRNVEVGDIVLVSYVSKLVKPTWRLGRITDTFPDEHGNVREVTVSTRSRKGKPEPPREYHSKPRDEQRLPVQRISVMVPASEVENIPPASEDLHLCDDSLHVPDLLTAQARDPASRQVRFQLPEDSRVADTTAYVNTLAANLSEVRLPNYLCQGCAQRQFNTW